MSSKRKYKHHRYDDSFSLSGNVASRPASSTSAVGGTLLETAQLDWAGRVKRNVSVLPLPAPRHAAATDYGALRADDLVPAQVYDLYDQEQADQGAEVSEEGPREMRDSDNPLREWVLENRDEFLAELLRWEGRGDHRAYDICPGGEMVCSACIVEHHKRTPLHVVEFWNGKSFQRQTLKDLGLRIQLGHWYQRDRACPVPEPAPGDTFVIVDNNGVHECSAYEFFHSLARETDNTGLLPPKDRYHEFLRMTREWANLKMLMRAARGNAASGIAGTSAGECALLCPACPQPGKNLPPGWENAPEEMHEEADPGLGPGCAFFCEVTAYMQHLADNWHMKQERMGDLQYGERYINMDYMFFLSIAGTELVRLYVSYDIACQWHKNIWIRMQQYKPELQFKADRKFMTFLVPKFHLPTHIEACNLQFSFNLTRDVGQTDGEAPERGWANANRLATSTKEKGPGARRDTLDDHFNERRLWRWVKDAVPAMEEMQAALIEMEASLSPEALGEEAGPIAEWTAMAEAWEKDESKPNPFETLRKDQHLAKVRQELAEEAAARQVAGRESAGEVRDDMHITEMIAMGLQLEDQQRTLRFDVLATGLHPTSDQTRTMVERSSKLRRKILAWIDISEGSSQWSTASMSLWLPSAMMKQAGLSRELPPLLKDTVQHEYRLRVGQANEALHEIRGQLLVRSHLYQMKDAYARGVRENMRSTSKIELCDERIRRMTAQYRNARLALGVLGRVLGREDWLVALKPLLDGDVRGMPHAQFGDPVRQRGGQAASKQKRKVRRCKRPKVDKPPSVLSWIWIAQVQDPAPGSSQAMNEAVRIEWAKARAHAMRWTEEVDLLEEEMRRIVQFLAWRGDWWEAQIAQRGLGDGPQLNRVKVVT
ncbi:hypothetical protein B0H15DRAFT_1006298 [Mycena belliarum]|uniref:CxC2-like cysteine cluster KDZ transposase-associated domain-containing protein n=1 Tax=Mycena belliarum TaxID=1033014 RepID=A0AAD6TQT9_9AGAR|nr:hypothetical protein B0H15DRAFT_1006298 [Mycena belliae]